MADDSYYKKYLVLVFLIARKNLSFDDNELGCGLCSRQFANGFGNLVCLSSDNNIFAGS